MMKSLELGILVLFLASTKLFVSTAVVHSSKRSRRLEHSNLEQFGGTDRNVSASARQIVIGPAHSSHEGSDSSKPEDEDSSKGSNTIRIPQINFYSSVPNSVGVIANGLLTLREMSATLGTPLPIFIGSLPMVVFGFLLMFLPDLTVLGLPLFYPSGADGDPLGAFPPLPDFSMEDLADFEALKTALKQLLLIPSDWF